MQTDRIKVASDGSGREQALQEAERFAQYVGLGRKEGLRVLLSAQKTMNRQGTMVVKNVNETIMEIFEVTGFSDILTIR